MLKHTPEYETRIFIREKGNGFWRQMNKIRRGSRFHSVNDRDLHKKERQIEVATEIVQGWIENGGKWNAKFKIVTKDVNASNEPPEVKYLGIGARD